jgi:hypothetical protein
MDGGHITVVQLEQALVSGKKKNFDSRIGSPVTRPFNLEQLTFHTQHSWTI